MTATTEAPATTGRVVRVTGPVVDVEFPSGSMPELFNALEVDVNIGSEDMYEGEGEQRTLTLEVAQHIGDNTVRTISMQQTDGLTRGAQVRDSGSAISVPVGDVTKGHVWNVLGKPLDVEESSLDIQERWAIHRPAPNFDQLESKTEVPPCWVAMLWISSMRSTVLPTPAPPKRPILPPLA